MRYVQKDKRFVSKRCTFDPHNMKAYSYEWWQFLACWNGKVYFNDVSYSMQTRLHQRGVKRLLGHLGVKYITVYVKAGLNNIQEQINGNVDRILELRAEIDNPRTKAAANKGREQYISYLERENKKLHKMLNFKETPYKGELNFKAIPGPIPLTPAQLERRRERMMRNNPERYAKLLRKVNVVQDVL